MINVMDIDGDGRLAVLAAPRGHHEGPDPQPRGPACPSHRGTPLIRRVGVPEFLCDQPVPAQRLYACAQMRRIKTHIGLPHVVRCERPTSLTADADRWHARPMGLHATLSCWRRDAYRGGRSRSRRLSRMPSRTVAAPLTGGAQVTADLSGRRLGADQGQGGADLGNVCASGACGWSRPWQPKLALLCRVALGQRDWYQATVCCTASRCAVGSRRPKAASNLLALTTKGARNW